MHRPLFEVRQTPQGAARLARPHDRAAGCASMLVHDTGLGRESLYQALPPSGNPKFATVMKVVAALGAKLCAAPWAFLARC
jgi:DNA-binding phage protein